MKVTKLSITVLVLISGLLLYTPVTFAQTTNQTISPDNGPGTICGTKFNDLNGNGVQDAGEPGLAGWQINISGSADLSVTTNETGSYCFNNLKPGKYTIAEVNQNGWLQTAPSTGTYSFELTSGQNIINLNFGNSRISSNSRLGSICGIKFNDLNGNGVQDKGEPALPDWQINIGGSADLSVTTNETGSYCFNNLKPGDYKIGEVMQSGWQQTAPSPGYYTVTLAAGQNIINLDFGNSRISSDISPGSICGVKFNDLNGNGVQDAGEPGLPGWQINISGSADLSVTTNETGSYCFNNLKPGKYTIGEVNQNGWLQTAPSTVTYSFELTSGQNIINLNFGNSRISSNNRPGSICGIKFNDINGNGVQDVNEPGLPNWNIQIIYPNGTVAENVTTNDKGGYCVTVPAGNYTISEVPQSGWTQTYPPSPGYYTVMLAAGQKIDSLNFGNHHCSYFCNGDFENNQVVSAGSSGFFNQSLVPCWNTTESDHIIEVWGNGSGGVPAYSGNQFIELNAHSVATLSQEFNSGPGGLVTISFAHRGRAGFPNTMNVSIGPVNGTPSLFGPFIANTTAWTLHTLPYLLLANTTYNLSFISLPVGGNSAGGNFLDAINVECSSDNCGGTEAWSPLGTGTNGEVWALAVIGTDLYAGGTFTTAGNVSANHIAKWDGSSWSSLGTGINNGMNGSVFSLAVIGTDLYAGGWFTTAGGSPAENIAKWDGTTWTPLGSGLVGSAAVEALAVSGTDLYTGGGFTTAGGVPAERIAKWDGTSWSALGSSGGMNDRVNSLTVIGTDLYAGGQFTTAGGVSANHIAKWNGTGWSPLGNGTDLRVGGGIGVMGGNLYPGGVFTTAGGVSANREAKWDGTSWSALGTGMNNEVEGFAVIGQDLYASGGFITAGGVSANRVAKWDGTSWSALGTGMNDGVWRLAVIGNDLYAGGIFTTAGDVSANYVAKWGCEPTTEVTPTATRTPAPTPTQTPKVPGFSLLVALVSLFIVVLKKRIK